MKIVTPSPLLRTALLADACASGAMALLQLALTPTLASWTRLPPPLLTETGLFLVVYVALLLALARNARLPAALVGLIVGGNVGWAAAAVALTAALEPSGLGIAFLAAHAVAVLAFAALEFAGLKASPAAMTPRIAPAR